MSDEVNASLPPRPYRWLKRVLGHAGADQAVVLLAIALIAPSLTTGLSGDDYLHQLIALGSSEIQGFVRQPLDMYRFTSSEHMQSLMREGVLPWWDDPQAMLAFFRPLSALTHYFDYQLFPDRPWLMHLHSLLWGALLLVGVLVLYRQLLTPTWVCALAVFLYAVDDARGWIGSWIAARNAVVATAISVWVLVLHHRARSRGQRASGWLGPPLLLLALLASEGAIAIFGYLVAYAFTLDRAPTRERLRSLWPYAAVLLGWRVAYRALGYGVANSGLYFDPSVDAWEFVRAFAERAPILLFSQAGGPWSDIYSVAFSFPLVQRLLWLAAVLGLLVIGYAIWPLVRRDEVVRFGLIGALCALIPASATFTADRMLTWVAIGGSLALARLIGCYVEEHGFLLQSPPRALLLPPLMIGLLLMKTVVDPLFLPSRARGNLIIRGAIDRASATIPVEPWIRDKHVVFVNPPGVPLGSYIPIERAAMGVPRPAGIHWLATGESELQIERIDARSLRVRQRGGFLQSPGSHLLRSPHRRFALDQRIDLGGMKIRIAELTADGRPSVVLAQFDRELEDPSLYWLRWDDLGYVRFVPPALGERVRVPSVDLTRALLGDMLRFPFDGRLPPVPDPAFAPEPAIAKQ